MLKINALRSKLRKTSVKTYKTRFKCGNELCTRRPKNTPGLLTFIFPHFLGKVELHGKVLEVEHSVPKRQR